MIKLVDGIIVANSDTELTTLESSLSVFSPALTFSIESNQDTDFPYKLHVGYDGQSAMPPMDQFFDFLKSAIDQVNSS